MRNLFSPLAIAAALALAITNPTVAQYSAWMKEQVASATKGAPLFGFLAYALGDAVIQSTTRRENFLLFSVFRTSLDGKNDITAIGLANNFVAVPSQATPWRPGGPSQQHPHVIAGADPDTWKPQDGYVWVRQPPNGDLRVLWQPGRVSETMPHLVAAALEERWVPEDGYDWNVNPPPPGQLGVHWLPGKSSGRYAHVVSASAEDRWLPAQGYRWVVDPPQPGDFRVRPIDLEPEAFDTPAIAKDTIAAAQPPIIPQRNDLNPELPKNPQLQWMRVTKRMIACGGPEDGPHFQGRLEKAQPQWMSSANIAPGCEALAPDEVLLLDQHQTEADTDIVVKLWRRNCVEHCTPYMSPLYGPPRSLVGAYLKPTASNQPIANNLRKSGDCVFAQSPELAWLFGTHCN